MATAAYLSEVRSVSRKPVDLVKLTVTGTVSASQIFRFSNKDAEPIHLQIGEDVRQYIINVSGRTVRLKPDRNLSERDSITITLHDDPNAPDFNSSNFTVFTGESFFKRLVVAQPDLVGATVEILRGFVKTGFLETDFERLFKGRLEDINFGKAGEVTIVARDNQVFLDREFPAEINDNNILENEGGIASNASFFEVSNPSEFTDPDTGILTNDFLPVVLRIDDEDIIVRSIVTTNNNVTVQSNLLSDSEDFTSVTPAGSWTPTGGTTITSNQAIGPFGGSAKADKLAFAAAGTDEIVQDTGVDAEGMRFLFSVWLKATSDITGTMSIKIGNTLATVFSDEIQVTLTSSWKRFQAAVQPFVGSNKGTVECTIKRASGDTLSECFAFGAQLELQPASTGQGVYVSTGDLGSAILVESGTAQDGSTNTITLRSDAPTTTGGPGSGGTIFKDLKIEITAGTGSGQIKNLIGYNSVTKVATVTSNWSVTPDDTSVYEITKAAGLFAGRGAFGSTAVSHAKNTQVKEVLIYRSFSDEDGIHPVIILRDMVNRALVAVADVDQPVFDDEFEFNEGQELRRGRATGFTDTTITKSANLLDLIKEVKESSLLDLWVGEDGKFKVRYSWRALQIGTATVKVLKDEENIIRETMTVQGNKRTRATRFFIFFDLIAGQDGDKREHYGDSFVFANVEPDSISGYKSKVLLSKWIYRNKEASTLTSRYVSRFLRGARIAKFMVDIKDDPDFNVGDIIDLDTVDVLEIGGASDDTAIRGITRWQVTKKQDRRKKAQVEVELLEGRQGRFGNISSLAGTDYDAATAAQQAEFCWIGRASDNKVGAALDEGYILQ